MKPVHGGNIYDYQEDIVDYSSNINPRGLPPKIARAIKSHIGELAKYPDIKYRALKNKLADWQGVEPQQILLGNGAAELIYLVAELFRGKKAILPQPTFSEYQAALAAKNCQCKLIYRQEEDNFALPRDKMLAILNKEEIAGSFICRPNNPDGSLLAREKLLPLLEKCEYVVIDESFIEYLPREESESFIPLIEEQQKLIILRSLTKFYALPGLRLGYLIAPKPIVKKLAANQPPWPINTLAAEAGSLIPECKKYRQKTLTGFQKAKVSFQQQLAELPQLKIFPGEANFILVKLKTDDFTARDLQQSMVARGFLLRNCASFAGLNEKFFRLAVKEEADNLKLTKALKAVLEDK